MGLELAKKMQHVMKHPGELPAMFSEAMDQLGVPAADKEQVCIFVLQVQTYYVHVVHRCRTSRQWKQPSAHLCTTLR
jgi:hypothetical protein